MQILRSSPAVTARPQPAVWSPLEYGAHVRDVFRLFDQRLLLMLTEDDPRFANWDQDETAIRERYAEQDPEVVADELEAAAEHHGRPHRRASVRTSWTGPVAARTARSSPWSPCCSTSCTTWCTTCGTSPASRTPPRHLIARRARLGPPGSAPPARRARPAPRRGRAACPAAPARRRPMSASRYSSCPRSPGVSSYMPEDVGDLGQGEAEPPAAQDELQPDPVAVAEDPGRARALRRQQALVLVEPDRAQRRAELRGELADRPGPVGHGRESMAYVYVSGSVC